MKYFSVSVKVPTVAVGEAVAAILGALDDKIELNRQMNATLVAIARVLFQCWFGDFDHVRTQPDGRHSADMDEGTASIPDYLEESGKFPMAGRQVSLATIVRTLGVANCHCLFAYHSAYARPH